VDLPNGAIERHNDPSEGGYRRMERVGRGRSLVSEALPDLTLNTDAVLGGG
jgi:ribosomal protein L13E